MKKKITSIKIDNYKGYFGVYPEVSLPEGENVIIYGENGSGKSSLYKAIDNFFQSSRDPTIRFAKNKYNEGESGEISIEFSNYNDTIGQIESNTNQLYQFRDSGSNHNVPFIQDATLVKGFLDYTDLLKIYLNDNKHPNLFNLIVLSILGNHIPISSGGSSSFKKKWTDLKSDLLTRCYTRKDLIHKRALIGLTVFEVQLKATLDDVILETNRYLDTYFKSFDLVLGYKLAPITINYPRSEKKSWSITADLRLTVVKNGQSFVDGYSPFLNEARLSAIAVCMYLASLKITNQNVSFQILYLDDVFIGLDSGNRIPILKILESEFFDYQKFISTYDRHWFELAKRYFELGNVGKWKAIELYVGSCNDASMNKIDKPIMIIGESYHDKALKYLLNNISPDYPAAANYFRKALEEMISKRMISFELVNSDYERLQEYKLSNLCNKTKRFFERIGFDQVNINTIIGLLHVILHPLSHHEITAPIYKQELIIIDKAYVGLEQQLKSLNINDYMCKLENNSILKIRIALESPSCSYEYQLKIKENLIVKETQLLPVRCYLTRLSGVENGSQLRDCNR